MFSELFVIYVHHSVLLIQQCSHINTHVIYLCRSNLVNTQRVESEQGHYFIFGEPG